MVGNKPLKSNVVSANVSVRHTKSNEETTDERTDFRHWTLKSQFSGVVLPVPRSPCWCSLKAARLGVPALTLVARTPWQWPSAIPVVGQSGLPGSNAHSVPPYGLHVEEWPELLTRGESLSRQLSSTFEPVSWLLLGWDDCGPCVVCCCDLSRRGSTRKFAFLQDGHLPVPPGCRDDCCLVSSRLPPSYLGSWGCLSTAD